MVLEYHIAGNSEEVLAPVEGIDGPIIDDGFVNVSNTPGLGYDFNEDILKSWVKRGGYFEPTTEWDGEQSVDGQFL